jgi:transcriptional regulator with XRE-family HTH domain
MPRTSSSSVASRVAGRAIREVRHEVGVTQAELARRMGTTPAYISALETGRTNSTIGHLWAVAEALGVELHLDFRVPSRRRAPDIPAPPDHEMAPSA